MTKEEFLQEVKKRGGLPSWQKTVLVTIAVLDSLRGMIDQDVSDRIYERAPKGLWPRHPVECVTQLIPAFESYDMYGFLTRVQKESGITNVGEAERLSYMVLKLLQEVLDEYTNIMIADDLPPDMRIMWLGIMEAIHSQQEQQPHQIPGKAEGVTAESGEHPRSQAPPEFLEAERYWTEKQLAGEIERLLDSSDELDASNINVQVMRGEVTLRGTVKTDSEREAAERIVSDATRSSIVRNEIRVRR